MARGVPRPINARIHDALVMRQVDLVRLANGEAASLVTGTMRAADEKIVGRLSLIEDPGRLMPRQVARVEERLTNILAVQERQTRKRLNAYIGDVAAAELVDCEALLARAVRPLKGIDVKTSTAGAAVVRARKAPIRGVAMTRLLQRFFRNDRERVRGQFRAGVADGQNTGALIRAVVGTRSKRFLDGVRQVSRRSIDAITQTITTHVSAQARGLIAEVNPDIISAERWVSVLDTSTCPVCGALDGKVFDVGEGVHPPVHVNCRCVRMPIIPNLRAIPADDKQFLPSTVADSFDGKSPQVLTYPAWLKSQRVEVQKDVLGPSRFALFKEGVPMQGFVNDRNKVLTLAELRIRSPRIFSMAGLD